MGAESDTEDRTRKSMDEISEDLQSNLPLITTHITTDEALEFPSSHFLHL